MSDTQKIWHIGIFTNYQPDFGLEKLTARSRMRPQGKTKQ